MNPKKTRRPSAAGAAEPEPVQASGDETRDPERLVRQFAETFKEARRADVAKVPNHVEDGRFDLVARLGHQIRGTAATFGLPEIGSSGARLETAARAEDPEGILAEAEVLRKLIEEP